MSLLPAVTHDTTPSPDAAVIWLHGLGADGHDFAPIVRQLNLPKELGIRFIFPHAPQIPVTINGGYIMPAWYDIIEMQIDRQIDSQQLLKSAEAICGFMHREIELGIDSRRIILAGFSQGGAVAYQSSLSFPLQLGGLLAMSTYFATADSINYHEVNSRLPVEIHHGSYDPVVPEQLGRKAHVLLSKLGYTVNYRTYPMEHNVCPQQIRDISSWLQSLLT